MIHYVVFYETQPHVDDPKRQEMARTARSLLLKIPEIFSVKSGRSLDSASQWSFFVSIEVDSLKKLHIVLEDPIYLKFLESVIKNHTSVSFPQRFELDPSLDLKYS